MMFRFPAHTAAPQDRNETVTLRASMILPGIKSLRRVVMQIGSFRSSKTYLPERCVIEVSRSDLGPVLGGAIQDPDAAPGWYRLPFTGFTRTLPKTWAIGRHSGSLFAANSSMALPSMAIIASASLLQ